MIDTKALREKVLDLAIRGKLVPQDPNDEPASVLLERIRAEKEQMVKDGKLKVKDIKNDTIIFKGDDNLHYERFADGSVKCIEDEIPFEVPDNWIWVRLQTVCQKEIKRGKAPKYAEKSGTLVFAQKCNTKSGQINISLAQYLDEINLHRYPIELFTQYGDIIINSTGTGTLGRVGIFEQKDDVQHLPIIPDSHITTVRVFPDLVNKYIFLFLKKHQSFFESSGEGSTNQKELRPDVIKSFIVAIPPLDEQKRIVEKFQVTSEIIRHLDDSTSSIKDTIISVKSKILDLAIHGKLVPQNPADEPASVLLERIRAEKEELIKQGKIKRDKKESVIFKGEDNSYYRNKNGQTICINNDLPIILPDGWTWAMLPEVVLFQEGPGILKKDFRENGIPLIRISGLQTEKVLLTGCDYLDYDMVEKRWQHFKLELGDVILCTSASIGKASIVGPEAVGAIPYTGQIRFKMTEAISREFFLYFATSRIYLDQIDRMKTGNCIQHYGPTHLKEIYIPVPPRVEQENIVKKLDSIVAQLTNIEQCL